MYHDLKTYLIRSLIKYAHAILLKTNDLQILDSEISLKFFLVGWNTYFTSFWVTGALIPKI